MGRSGELKIAEHKKVRRHGKALGSRDERTQNKKKWAKDCYKYKYTSETKMRVQKNVKYQYAISPNKARSGDF